MITAVLKNGNVIGEFKSYNGFYKWLLCSQFGVVDMGKSLARFQREGGTVIMERIDDSYLKALHIKED